MEKGQMRSAIDQTFSLEQTADAIRYLETMRARGKVVVTIQSSPN
jgi:NADPH:quinone reductase-like Zn-dependent oxidoreductase